MGIAQAITDSNRFICEWKFEKLLWEGVNMHSLLLQSRLRLSGDKGWSASCQRIVNGFGPAMGFLKRLLCLRPAGREILKCQCISRLWQVLQPQKSKTAKNRSSVFLNPISCLEIGADSARGSIFAAVASGITQHICRITHAIPRIWVAVSRMAESILQLVNSVVEKVNNLKINFNASPEKADSLHLVSSKHELEGIFNSKFSNQGMASSFAMKP